MQPDLSGTCNQSSYSHADPTDTSTMAGLFKSRYVAVLVFFFVALAMSICGDLYGLGFFSLATRTLAKSHLGGVNSRCTQPAHLPPFDIWRRDKDRAHRTGERIEPDRKYLLYYAPVVGAWGLNNKIFFLKENLYAARMLNRILILPPKLMTLWPKSCTDIAVCDAHFEKTGDGRHYIPLGHLYDLNVLRNFSAVVAGSPDTEVSASSISSVDQVGLEFKWVDQYSTTTQFYFLEPCPGYSWYHMDLVHGMRNVPPGSTSIKGVVEEYGGSEAHVLDLTPSNIWGSPRSLQFSSWERYDAYRKLSREAFVPGQPIVKLAQRIANSLELDSGNSLMCLHWRRRDYVTQWGDAARVGYEQLLAGLPACFVKFDSVLIAANERDPEVLRNISALGGKTVLLQELVEKHVDLSELPVFAFNEAIGMVEQLVCAQAAAFIGTSGSSFAGQVNNLRGAEGLMCPIDGYTQCLVRACGKATG